MSDDDFQAHRKHGGLNANDEPGADDDFEAHRKHGGLN